MAQFWLINRLKTEEMGYFSKRLLIHPEDTKDLAYWTRKWGVNVKQINDAIIETGSINKEVVKNMLEKKGHIWTLSFWIHKLFKNPVRL